MKRHNLPVVLLLSFAMTLAVVRKLSAGASEDADTQRGHFVTNAAQFRSLSGADYLAGCDFRLTGVVTLVDTNRGLLVVQDETGAVALNVRIEDHSLTVGEQVSLVASNCCPAFARFPDYPHHPSGWDIRSSLEAPSNWWEYYLTRMRGFIHPPVSGQYTFWIAGDNSSELWLSLGDNPSTAKKIAFIARFGWVAPREWSKFPSQRSEPISLEAGQSYYIEALHEQTTGANNLAVAWQGPRAGVSVIAGEHLTPWNKDRNATNLLATNGILREYWTNFSAGDLSGIGGARPFESTLGVQQLRVISRHKGELPKPSPISFDLHWLDENNYRWVEAEGVVTFVGEGGANVFLQLMDGYTQVQLRTLPANPALSRLARHDFVRIEGVCEGIFDEKGTLVPGLIWVAKENGVSVVETAPTDLIATTAERSLKAKPIQPITTTPGFYGTRG